jgi:hypothetical protein
MLFIKDGMFTLSSCLYSIKTLTFRTGRIVSAYLSEAHGRLQFCAWRSLRHAARRAGALPARAN